MTKIRALKQQWHRQKARKLNAGGSRVTHSSDQRFEVVQQSHSWRVRKIRRLWVGWIVSPGITTSESTRSKWLGCDLNSDSALRPFTLVVTARQGAAIRPTLHWRTPHAGGHRERERASMNEAQQASSCR